MYEYTASVEYLHSSASRTDAIEIGLNEYPVHLWKH